MILQNAITSIISPELSMVKTLLKYPQFAVQPIHYYYKREVENQTTNKHRIPMEYVALHTTTIQIS